MCRRRSAIIYLLRARQERGREARDFAKRAGAGNRAGARTQFTQDPRKLPTRQRFDDLILSYFQIPPSAYSRIPYESG